MMKENTIKIFEESFRNNWELPALSDYNTKQTLTYGDFAEQIARLHIIYKECGVKPGDRVAVIGKNTPSWVIVFIGTITYGAVIVPILQEFNPRDAQHIINRFPPCDDCYCQYCSPCLRSLRQGARPHPAE